ncbi:MAG: hypothetical protein P8X79_06810 [Reinekea sp.]
MSQVKSLPLQRQKSSHDREAWEGNDPLSFHSPVPQLIELLEPILEQVKADRTADVSEDIHAFLSSMNLWVHLQFLKNK